MAAATLLGVLALAGWLGLGALRVLWSVDDHRAAWARRALEPGDLLYVALGDSAAQGVGASTPERGYVGVVAERLAARTGRTVRVVNLSVSGARAADVVRDQLGPLADLDADLVTVAVGGNDAGRTSPEDFRASLEQVRDALPPGALVADVPDFGGGPRRPAAAELAAVARDVVAARADLVPVALERATAAMGWGSYAGDFFHPNDRGHRVWAGAFLDALEARDAPGVRP